MSVIRPTGLRDRRDLRKVAGPPAPRAGRAPSIQSAARVIIAEKCVHFVLWKTSDGEVVVLRLRQGWAPKRRAGIGAFLPRSSSGKGGLAVSEGRWRMQMPSSASSRSARFAGILIPVAFRIWGQSRSNLNVWHLLNL